MQRQLEQALAPQNAQKDIPAVPTKRNHLDSSQQLLVKQAVALKKVIDFQKLEQRIADAHHHTVTGEVDVNDYYDSCLALIESAEKDISQLKSQGINTQQFMVYFANRHSLNEQALTQRLQDAVMVMIDGIAKLKQQFLKRYGPGFFKKSAHLSTERFDEWIIELANLYKSGHIALRDWQRELASMLNKALNNT